MIWGNLWVQTALAWTVVTRLTCLSLGFLICKMGREQDPHCRLLRGCNRTTHRHLDLVLETGLCSVTHFCSRQLRRTFLQVHGHYWEAHVVDTPFTHWAPELPKVPAGGLDHRAAGARPSVRHGSRRVF